MAGVQIGVRFQGLDQVAKTMKLTPLELRRAVASTLNQTAQDFQAAQRTNMAAQFTERRKQWVDRNVKLSHFAKPVDGELFATVEIQAPGDASRSDILSKFEQAGMKQAKDGGELAIPDQARRTKADIVAKNQRPKAFGFREVGSGPRAKVFQGANRTFMIVPSSGKGGGIFQRTGRGNKRLGIARGSRRMAMGLVYRNLFDANVKRLFGFAKAAKIRERLGFIETARKTANAKAAANADRALDKALAKLGFKA